MKAGDKIKRFYAKYTGLISGMFYNEHEPDDEGVHEKFFGLANAAYDIKKRTDYHTECLERHTEAINNLVKQVEMVSAQLGEISDIPVLEFEEDEKVITRLECCDVKVAYINNVRREFERCKTEVVKCGDDELCINTVVFNDPTAPVNFRYGRDIAINS